ncbi:MAG TPA: hypothetical protein VD864_14685, partial [Nocardioides sp.]|nr:hypothetical protein [Nocardioides sp.]
MGPARAAPDRSSRGHIGGRRRFDIEHHGNDGNDGRGGMSKQGRIRTQEMRKAQQEAAVRQNRRRRIVTAVGILVILGLLVAIVWAVASAMGGDDGPTRAVDGEVVVPANGNASGAVPVGDPD